MRRHRGQLRIEQVEGVQAAAQPQIEGDAHVLRRVQVGLPGVVHDHRRAHQPQPHLHVHVLQQRIAGGLQAPGIAGDQLFAQPPGDLHRGLLDQVAQLALALQKDLLVGVAVDADAILVAVHHARLLVVIGAVVDVVEVQRTDDVGPAALAVGIQLHHRPQPRAQRVQLRRIDEILQLMPRGQAGSLVLHPVYAPPCAAVHA